MGYSRINAEVKKVIILETISSEILRIKRFEMLSTNEENHRSELSSDFKDI